jgi:hypothetical protein
MLGQAKLFANPPGQPAVRERKVNDKSDKEWDMAVLVAFHFWHMNNEKTESGLGMAIKRTKIITLEQQKEITL